MKKEILKEELVNRLLSIDREIFAAIGTKVPYQFIIVGGSALILNFKSSRGTPDIDVLDLDRRVFSIAEKYDMNTRVNAFYSSFPYNYEDRLVRYENPELKVCEFYTPSLEDLVVSKIAANRPKDIEDITSNEVLKQLNWKKLIKIVEKDKEFSMASLNERQNADFENNYKKYKDKYYKK